jgi:hypothetical protein
VLILAAEFPGRSNARLMLPQIKDTASESEESSGGLEASGRSGASLEVKPRSLANNYIDLTRRGWLRLFRALVSPLTHIRFMTAVLCLA